MKLIRFLLLITPFLAVWGVSQAEENIHIEGNTITISGNNFTDEQREQMKAETLRRKERILNNYRVEKQKKERAKRMEEMSFMKEQPAAMAHPVQQSPYPQEMPGMNAGMLEKAKQMLGEEKLASLMQQYAGQTGATGSAASYEEILKQNQ